MTLAIIQARLNSSRFPNKILEEINGERMLDWVIARTLMSDVDEVVVASPDDLTLLVPVFVGSEDDVLDRYYQCAKEYGADIIVRITADCPLLDPDIIDFALKYFNDNRYPYVNIAPINGLDVEVFSMDLLEEAWEDTTERKDREHVTPYMKRKTKLSVDTRWDLANVRRWVHDMGR